MLLPRINLNLYLSPKQGLFLLNLINFSTLNISEKHNLKAVLINPVLNPYEVIQQYIGLHENSETGNTFHIEKHHADQLRELETLRISKPKNFLVLVQEGDEIFNQQVTIERFADANLLVQENGSHEYEGFESIVDNILKFCQIVQ